MYEVLSTDLNHTKLKPGHPLEHIAFDIETQRTIIDRHQQCLRSKLQIPTVLLIMWEMPGYKPLSLFSSPRPTLKKTTKDKDTGKGKGKGKGEQTEHEKYNGLSYNLIFLCVVSQSYLDELNTSELNVNVEPSHNLWYRVVEGTEINIRDRMKLICKVINPVEICNSVVDRGLAKKFNSKPLLVKPQHSFSTGILSVDTCCTCMLNNSVNNGGVPHEKGGSDGGGGGDDDDTGGIDSAAGITFCSYVIDVHRFPYLARSTAARLMPRIPKIRLQLGLVVEGRTDNELPERMLMCTQLEDLDLVSSQSWVMESRK